MANFYLHRFNPKSVNLETYARKLLYLLRMYLIDFMKIGPREHNQKGVNVRHSIRFMLLACPT